VGPWRATDPVEPQTKPAAKQPAAPEPAPGAPQPDPAGGAPPAASGAERAAAPDALAKQKSTAKDKTTDAERIRVLLVLQLAPAAGPTPAPSKPAESPPRK
jgi:hypothetical protein